MSLSPLMQQYLSVKKKYADAIIFFRVGDFYEMFFDDAKTASAELELTLTGKDCGLEERAPMCGVPFHSYESYAARLVSKGYKVAVCEQTEMPSQAKGLVSRDVIRIITPGTVMESSMLDESSNNYICSIFTQSEKTGMAFCDISTGEFYATLLQNNDENYDEMSAETAIKDELLRYSPKELLIGGDTVRFKTLPSFIKDKLTACVNMLEDEKFSFAENKKRVLEHFSAKSLDEINLDEKEQVVSAVGALFEYLSRTQMTGLERIRKIEFYKEEQYVHLDYSTRKNLELVEPLNSKNKQASLLAVLDKTKTSMGKRLMRSRIEKPLVNIGLITKRQNAVGELVENIKMRINVRDSLTGMFDIQRVTTRIVYGSANARELRSMFSAFSKLPKIRECAAGANSRLLKEIYSDIDTLNDLAVLIDSAITDEPPFSVREGGLIKDGYSKELDELRYDMNNSSELMAQVEKREREKTGIPKLKIGFNRVFGYYIEVTNNFKDKVPPEYIRKQTLSNGERYITEELKELERRLLGAKDRAVNLEYEIFSEIRSTIAKAVDRISVTAAAVAELDVICTLAQVAYDYDYCCPTMTDSGIINISQGRHPVVERLQNGLPFVPNDTLLDKDENRVAIITGPNMSGKSTYMRQTAIIVLMAQMGSFVPAKKAEISVVDSIFTRIGASDDLAMGQSTFMVEMSEVANILKNATSKSLLILDEIGRGTSTFDGMSIARAVLEYTADKKKLGAKTLFSTHYHELTDLESKISGVKNYNIAAVKRDDDITFLRRIIPGAADESYGIEVAKLAGIPESVIQRAKKILKDLESSSDSEKKPKKQYQSQKDDISIQPEQIMFPSANAQSPIEKRLREIDINKVTPIEAMNVLFELKKLLR